VFKKKLQIFEKSMSHYRGGARRWVAAAVPHGIKCVFANSFAEQIFLQN
jgi:hypothetical protein